MITSAGIDLGFIFIYWYAIIIVCGMILALTLAVIEAKKFGVDSERIIDLFFVMLPFGIIGARLYYVAFEWERYQNNVWEIMNIRNGGLAIYGGLIAGGIAAYLASKGKIKFGNFMIKPFNFMLFVDIVAPLVILAQGIGRWGNFVNQEAYGGVVPGGTATAQIAYLKQFFIPDFIIEKMNIGGVYHHPTFLYESVWNILGFVVMYFVIRHYKKLKLGDLTACYFVWYGIGRFWIEGMRTDSLYIFDVIRVSQVVSIILVIIGSVVLLLNHFHKNSIPRYRDAEFEQAFPFLKKLLDK